MRGVPVAREGLPLVSLSLILSCLLFFVGPHIFFKALSIAIFFFFLFCLYFFRNPRRFPRETGDVLISPADGTITEVVDAKPNEFLSEKSTRVTVFMSPADVHVNRAPCDGVVERVEHRPGEFALAFKKDIDKDNERNYILLRCKEGQGHILLVQIAGFLARRIISYVKESDRVKQAEPIGMIAFGSRVDIYVPESYSVVVGLRDKVKAGETVVARRKGEV